MLKIHELLTVKKSGLSYQEYFKKYSPYLADLIIKHNSWLCDNADKDFDELLNAFEQLLNISLLDSTHDSLMSLLRVIKARSSLVIALYDVMAGLDVSEITMMLSKTADILIKIAFKAGCIEWIKRGKLPLSFDRLDAGSGLIIVGMGKLGAFELNFSSDIDICVFFDPEAIPEVDDDVLYDGFIRATKSAVRILSDRTSDGYVYRVDLRLRPDPSSTKIAVPIKVAEYYYERSGQNWERAAWIKARFICGDPVSWIKLRDLLRPFIWRRNLDYASIQDIHSIKRQIHSHYGHDEIKVYGHDVKLGKGGIREIELFVQTQQLIGGGRDMRLRDSSTLKVLFHLADKNWITHEVAENLSKAYKLFRKVEHRLQMVDDAQTHKIPEVEQDFLLISEFCDFTEKSQFIQKMTDEMICVSEAYRRLFQNQPQLSAQKGSLVFTGTDYDPNTVEHLTEMGFKDAKRVVDIISAWHKGHYRAMRSAKAREILTEITPVLLSKLANSANPDKALLRIDHFLSGLPAGVAFFSYLMNSHALMDLLIDIMSYAPNLADFLSHYPSTFDAMTDVSFFNPPLYEQDFEQELKFQLRPNLSQDKFLNAMRRFCREQKFRIGVLVLRNYMTAEQASVGFTALARVCIRYIVSHIEAELRNKYHLPFSLNDNNSLCVVAMGSLGAGEMNSASDLDLMMIYDGDFTFDGIPELPIDSLSYYAKLGKRILTALTVATEEGALYDVDMRLRPSGNSGPLVIHFDRFKQYQASEAHTWEKCALTRAEPICGSEALQQKIRDVLRQMNYFQEDNLKIRNDIQEMRLKLLDARKPKNIWDIKLTKGGIFDITFIVQYLILTNKLPITKIFSNKTKENLDIFLENTIIDKQQHKTLVETWEVYQELLHIFAIAKIDILNIKDISKKIQQRLCEFLRIENFQKAEKKLYDYNQKIIEIYSEIFKAQY